MGMESYIPKLQQQCDAVHTLMSESSRLWFLADVVPIKIWGYTNVISLEDVYLIGDNSPFWMGPWRPNARCRKLLR